MSIGVKVVWVSLSRLSTLMFFGMVWFVVKERLKLHCCYRSINTRRFTIISKIEGNIIVVDGLKINNVSPFSGALAAWIDSSHSSNHEKVVWVSSHSAVLPEEQLFFAR